MFGKLALLALLIQLPLNGLIVVRACSDPATPGAAASSEEPKASCCCAGMCGAQKGGDHQCAAHGAQSPCGISSDEAGVSIMVFVLGRAILPSWAGPLASLAPCDSILELSDFYQDPHTPTPTPPPRA